MAKVFFSVELEATNYADDTFCGSYEECVIYLITHGYTNDNARIVKFALDKGGEERVLCEGDVILQPNDDPEAVEIIDDWSNDWGTNFKQLRERYSLAPARLTQSAMSDITGIPARTLGNWETGQAVPPPYMLELVACKLRNNMQGGNNG